MAVMADERFRSLKTTWAFWVLSDDFGDYAILKLPEPGAKDPLAVEPAVAGLFDDEWKLPGR